MELNQQYIDELIAKYLAGEALPDEAIMLDDWRASTVENNLYFIQSKKAFQLHADKPIDTKALFERVNKQKQVRGKVISLHSFFTPIRIAASIILISIVGVLAYAVLKTTTQPDTILSSGLIDIQKEQLADGSNVILNKKSKLTLIGGFNDRQRKVKLEGEAYFEVIHNADKPFLVDAGGLLIEDIGTAFNIKANPESDSVWVWVTEGVVELTAGSQQKKINANQSAVYVKATRQILDNPYDDAENLVAYATRRFVFKAQPLKAVVSTINNAYGKVLVLENKNIFNCQITVTFNNDSPETIANVIAETLGLTVQKKGNLFYLTGNVCQQ